MPHDITKPLPIGVGVMLVDSLGRVAVSQRLGEGPLEGYWQFPGGAPKDADELPGEAVLRELKEETGLLVSNDRIQGLAASEVRHDPYPYLAYTYMLRVRDDEELTNPEPDKHTNWFWVTPEFASILKLIPGSGTYLVFAKPLKPEPVQARPLDRACDACRYFKEGSRANGWVRKCLAFGWELNMAFGFAVTPVECIHGEYPPREEEV